MFLVEFWCNTCSDICRRGERYILSIICNIVYSVAIFISPFEAKRIQSLRYMVW